MRSRVWVRVSAKIKTNETFTPTTPKQYLDLKQNWYFALKQIYSMDMTRALRKGHSLSQHTQFLKNNMIAENDF